MLVLRLPCRAKAALLRVMNFFVQRSELRDLYDKVAAVNPCRLRSLLLGCEHDN